MINGLAGLNGDKMVDTIIHFTRNSGKFVIDVRLLSDNYGFKDYIDANYHEQEIKPIKNETNIFFK